jgi:hypothetical protein
LNTPAHIVVGLAILGRGRGRQHERWIVLGTLLPDLPMFGFYLWQRLALATPERTIWSSSYFEPAWQNFFDLFNSIPLALIGLAIAARYRAWPAIFLCGGLLLHSAMDLPLHHEDAHGHFFPLSSWHFESPISYWDPDRFGRFGAGIELACVAIASATLFRRTRRIGVRALLVALVGLYGAGYVGFYWLRTP